MEPGSKLTAGAPFFTVESMKMETKISVPEDLDGATVENIIGKLNKPLKLNNPVLSFKR